MNKALIIFVLLSSIGCKSTGPYWSSRAHDLTDIVSVTVGIGGGAKAMTGPLHAGFFWGMNGYGIENGVAMSWDGDAGDFDNFILPLGPVAPAITRNPPIFGFRATSCRTCEHLEMAYSVPFFALPEPASFQNKRPAWAGGTGPLYQPVLIHDHEHGLQLLTKFEVDLGLGYSIRFGVNPGEFLDFLVGIVGLDIYGDDGIKKEQSDET